MDYAAALSYLYSFANYERVMPTSYTPTSFSLDKAQALMALLGHPECGFASIHVAGTKGKGSTARAIQQILAAAGHRVGLYTSPHLHTYRERIRINDRLISEEELAAIVSDLPATVADFERDYAQLGAPSTFELGTAAAFLYFAAQRVDYAVIEVGVGGRLDTTNVITPVLSVITSISRDHVKLLGDTIPLIASEKAGIIKTGVPVISAAQSDDALAVIKSKAKAERAPLTLVGRDVRLAGEAEVLREDGKRAPVGQRFEVEVRPGFPHDRATMPPITISSPLLGAHQRENIAVAVGAGLLLGMLGANIHVADIQQGLAQAYWPGRLEVLRDEPNQPLILADGAHNDDSARRLRETLTEPDLYPHVALTLIIGTVEPHAADAILAELAPIADRLLIATPDHPRASDPTKLTALAQQHARPGTPLEAAGSVAAAIELAQASAGASDLICCTGSLFVVAEARAAMGLAGASDPVHL